MWKMSITKQWMVLGGLTTGLFTCIQSMDICWENPTTNKTTTTTNNNNYNESNKRQSLPFGITLRSTTEERRTYNESWVRCCFLSLELKQKKKHIYWASVSNITFNWAFFSVEYDFSLKKKWLLRRSSELKLNIVTKVGWKVG